MRLSQLTLRVFALCAALFCNRAAQADETVATSPEKIELRIHAQKGQTYDRIMAMYQKTSQTIQGKRYDVNVTMRFDLRSEVLDISPAGDTHVRQTYRRVQFSMDTPRTNSNAVPTNFTLRYDSARPPKILPAEAAVMAALGFTSDSKILSGVNRVAKPSRLGPATPPCPSALWHLRHMP